MDSSMPLHKSYIVTPVHCDWAVRQYRTYVMAYWNPSLSCLRPVYAIPILEIIQFKEFLIDLYTYNHIYNPDDEV